MCSELLVWGFGEFKDLFGGEDCDAHALTVACEVV